MAQQALDTATEVGDTTTEELTEAWDRAVGREPNASDVWDHAIKAVEAALALIFRGWGEWSYRNQSC